MKQELWKPVVGYESDYEISNTGKLRSIKRGRQRLLKSSVHRDGYLKLALCKNNKVTTAQAHRVVAQAFIPNPMNLKQVNHINGNKKDNRVDNLEWMSGLDNMRHSYATGLRKIGSNSWNAKLIESDIPVIRKLIKVKTLAEIAKIYGVNGGTISDIKSGRSWKHVI